MMGHIMEMEGLCKQYPDFVLDHISMTVDEGQIMGFIGRNGAGKTTTLKAAMNLIHPNEGRISFWGMDMADREREIKQKIGYVSGGVIYYQRRRLGEIASVTSGFYADWDEGEYRRYMTKFALDEKKTPVELSEGMKVKFQLALALSHHAKMLILDEPTSGLDPVSRDELLEVFLTLADRGVAILFSTHITSDLDKCADAVTYLRRGQVVASLPIGDFRQAYRILELDGGKPGASDDAFLGVRRSRDGYTALILSSEASRYPGEKIHIPDLESIMQHLEKEGGN